jgi:hypothetical protein
MATCFHRPLICLYTLPLYLACGNAPISPIYVDYHLGFLFAILYHGEQRFLTKKIISYSLMCVLHHLMCFERLYGVKELNFHYEAALLATCNSKWYTTLKACLSYTKGIRSWLLLHRGVPCFLDETIKKSTHHNPKAVWKGTRPQRKPYIPASNPVTPTFHSRPVKAPYKPGQQYPNLLAMWNLMSIFFLR